MPLYFSTNGGAGLISMVNFPDGNYLLNMIVQNGTSLASTSGTILPSNGAQDLNIYAGDTVAGNTTGSTSNILTEFAFTIINN